MVASLKYRKNAHVTFVCCVSANLQELPIEDMTEEEQQLALKIRNISLRGKDASSPCSSFGVSRFYGHASFLFRKVETCPENQLCTFARHGEGY